MTKQTGKLPTIGEAAIRALATDKSFSRGRSYYRGGALFSIARSGNKIKAMCRKNKMYYLQEEGLLKVIDGTTSMNEVLRILRNGEKQG